MNTEVLSDVLNDIDDKYLVKCEAARSRKPVKRIGRIMLYASAAVILLAVTGAVIHGWMKRNESPADPNGSPSGPVTENSTEKEATVQALTAEDTASVDTSAPDQIPESYEDSNTQTADSMAEGTEDINTSPSGLTLAGIINEAAPENSALIIYRFDGENTVRRLVFDEDMEYQVIHEIAGLGARAADQEILKDWKEPCYGLEIGDKEGFDIWLSYSDGIWLNKDGSVFTADYDLAAVYDKASQDNEDVYESGIYMPNAAILGKRNTAYYKKASGEKKTAEGVTLELRSISEEGTLTCVLTNQSGEEYAFGKGHNIQKKVNGEWYILPVAVTNYGWEDILCLLGDGQSTEFIFDLWPWGDLEPGEYRIAIDADETVYAEFQR